MVMMSSDNQVLAEWVREVAKHTQPENIEWCTGSDEEYAQLVATMLQQKSLVALNESSYPRSYIHNSDPTDVARTEHLTFISTGDKSDVGPTNNWMSQQDAEARVWPQGHRIKS